MSRGFTILELLISLAVLAILFSVALSSFSTLSRQTKMVSLASSLQSFLYQAKSEAIYRNRDLWGHFIIDNSQGAVGEWELQVTDSDQPGAEVLMHFSGQSYTNIIFDTRLHRMKFDGVRGKISNNSIEFYPANDMDLRLKVVTSYGAGRIRICAEQSEIYDYPICGS